MLAAALVPCLLLLADPPYANDRQVAPSWTATESTAYQASIDRKVAHTGTASLALKSTGAGDPQGYAVRQRIRAASWRGKKVRLSGWIKTDRIDSGGGAIWLRIDTASGDYILDGMLERKGSDWTRAEVVALIPDDAVGITFGARMVGQGQMWADDFQLEPAPPKALTTTIERRKSKGTQRVDDFLRAAPRPGNLNFEQ